MCLKPLEATFVPVHSWSSSLRGAPDSCELHHAFLESGSIASSCNHRDPNRKTSEGELARAMVPFSIAGTELP